MTPLVMKMKKQLMAGLMTEVVTMFSECGLILALADELMSTVVMNRGSLRYQKNRRHFGE